MRAHALSRPRPLAFGFALRVALAVAAALVPLALLDGYGLATLTEVAIFAIVAASLDLLLGYTGLVSFGHAAFFGLGAYTTVLVSLDLDASPWLGLLAGVGVATIAAALIGVVSVRLNGISFFMVTLAFAQLLASGAVKWRTLTGGSDGIGGLMRPSVGPWDLASPQAMYLLAAALLLAAYLALRIVVGSQFGHALVGARENDLRMRALGYRTQALRLVAFILSGAVAGLGGALYAFYNGFVSPELLSWGTSGMLLLMVALGGKGTLLGPMLGALVYLLMQNVVSSQTEHWMLIVGIIFVACVLFFPDGLFGILQRLARRERA